MTWICLSQQPPFFIESPSEKETVLALVADAVLSCHDPNWFFPIYILIEWGPFLASFPPSRTSAKKKFEKRIYNGSAVDSAFFPPQHVPLSLLLRST
jgi:hypothetical protein